MSKHFTAILCILCLGGCATPTHRMERIVVAQGSRGFVLAQSKKAFHPWGFNYGNDGRLMEDYWAADWPTIVSDFRKMKALGANVVRVHLQYGKFMAAPDHPNRAAFQQLRRLVKLAEETGVYLDVTGLACYRPTDTPKWYDALDDAQRWAAQANFWRATAAACAGSHAVFCYDLMNEPLAPSGKRQPGQWRSGSSFGGYDFLQFIALDPGGRPREEIPVAWIRAMTKAIRSRDRHALITVGLLPWSREWGYLSGFAPEKVAPELDFLSVHIYPDSKKPAEAMEGLRKFAAGKPVVIEETFALSCNIAEEEQFLRDSKSIACGWIGHFNGLSLADYAALEKQGKLTPPQAAYRDWEQLSVKLTSEFLPSQK